MEKCSNLFKSVQSSHELALRYPKVRMKFSGFFISLSLSMASIAHAADSSDWQTPTRDSVQKMAVTLNQTVKLWPVPGLIFRIEDFGAVGDGLTLNTVAIQKAIDVCSAAGGGTVLVHAGDYVTGTIEFKTGVTLQIDRGARILGSLHSADYPDKTPAHLTAMDTILHITKSLIYAEGCDHIGIRGQGIIDGRGVKKNWPRKNTGPHPPVNDRPFLIRVIECRNVEMDGIHLRDSASWMEDYLNCDDLILDGVNVENQGNYNNDGFDIDGCRNVIVRNCFINSWDDAMCFKGAGLREMQNVLVENCTAYSGCNCLKYGTDSEADFKNVLIRNVKLGGVPADLPAFKRRNATSGISWESVDSGSLQDIIVSNARIDRVDSPIFLRIGDRGRKIPGLQKTDPGSLSRIIFEQIGGSDNGVRGSIIAGIPGARIEDVLIRDMNLSMAGGGKSISGSALPENIADYPDSNMFGESSPAYGFWLRHAKGVSFENVRIDPKRPDERPEFNAGDDTRAILLNGSAISDVAKQ
jgi:polygalacturonase